mgnify:FL=1|jgi:hypothetical protein
MADSTDGAMTEDPAAFEDGMSEQEAVDQDAVDQDAVDQDSEESMSSDAEAQQTEEEPEAMLNDDTQGTR